jgi:hypothetical protein
LREVEMGSRNPSQSMKKRPKKIQKKINEGDDDRINEEGIKTGEEGHRVEKKSKRETPHRRTDKKD